jgi:hypothetical protein
MSATLLELRDQLIIDTGVQGNPQFPTGRLNRLLNLAQRYIQTELNGLGMKKWETAQDISGGLTGATFSGVSVKTVDIGSTYFLHMLESPDSILFLDCSGVEEEVQYNGIAYAVDVSRFQEQVSNTYLAPTLKKPVFTRLANKVWIAPSIVTSATAYYYKAITDMTSDVSTTEIPIEFEGFLLKKAVLEVEQILGKLDEKELKMRQLEKDIASAYQKFLGKQVEQQRESIKQKQKLQ